MLFMNYLRFPDRSFDLKYIAGCALCCTVLIFLTGCTHLVRFQTIDGHTGRPLPNVSVRWTKVRYHGLLDLDTNSVWLPKTDTNGAATINGTKAWHNFRFECPGYWPANVVLLPRGQIGIISPDKLNEREASELTNVAKISFPVVVAMFPK